MNDEMLLNESQLNKFVKMEMNKMCDEIEMNETFMSENVEQKKKKNLNFDRGIKLIIIH